MKIALALPIALTAGLAGMYPLFAQEKPLFNLWDVMIMFISGAVDRRESVIIANRER